MSDNQFTRRGAARPSRVSSRVVPVVVTLGLLGVANLLSAPGTSAATVTGPVPNCHLSMTGATCTVTYSYTGGEQSFAVPTDMTNLTVRLIGANGGTGDNSQSAGGRGATVTAVPTVPVGQRTLYLEVGGNGGNGLFGEPGSTTCPPEGDPGLAGGFNGGGAASSPGNNSYCFLGGSGGGATDLRTSPSSAAGSLTTRLAVAAGGGGGGGDGDTESAGGDAGQDGHGSPYVPAGQAGQPTTGGAGSHYAGNADLGSDGSLGIGGNGILFGGGGGGGLYGGGGAFAVGAGGGSSLGTVTGLATAPPSVVLTYNSLTTYLANPTPPVLPALPVPLPSGPSLPRTPLPVVASHK